MDLHCFSLAIELRECSESTALQRCWTLLLSSEEVGEQDKLHTTVSFAHRKSMRMSAWYRGSCDDEMAILCMTFSFAYARATPRVSSMQKAGRGSPCRGQSRVSLSWRRCPETMPLLFSYSTINAISRNVYHD